ncbi:MAG: hypothetical protein A2X58_07495 [Nitrospirae bacterium GWC2_56_14]|nr:MAG: hypothetical protein A2X58_07495 [Nitrospirae bacterium GWC2_56_14]
MRFQLRELHRLFIHRGIPFAVLLALFLSGCVNTTFVYKPATPTTASAPLPVTIAVLPFADGTENFTQRGGIFIDQKNLTFNLAKSGLSGTINALTPDLWAKALADEMSASKKFQGVRFVYSRSEVAQEDLYIEGTLNSASIAGTIDRPSHFALALRALRRGDNSLAWATNLQKTWSWSSYEGCGLGIQCTIDRFHGDVHNAMQGLFREAITDLAATLSASAGNRGNGPSQTNRLVPMEPAPQPAAGSVDETIENILKEKF